MSTTQITPEVLWAQRSSATTPTKNIIYLTIGVADVPPEKCKIELKPTSVTFTGTDIHNKNYHVELEFYAEIDVEASTTHHSARDVEFVLRKKESKDEYWPRLTKESKKLHFVKTDFDKWVDEDEQNETAEDDFSGGMGDMGGMGGMGEGGFPGIDFSKLGGGAGGMDFGDMGKDGESDDDDEMPGLEDEEGEESAKTETTKASPKIEEVS